MNHYLNQCWLRSMTPYSVTRPSSVNLFMPDDAYIRQWAVSYAAFSTLSLYRNLRWLLGNRTTTRVKLQWNMNENKIIFFQKIHLKKSPTKWRPFCSSFNMLTTLFWDSYAANFLSNIFYIKGTEFEYDFIEYWLLNAVCSVVNQSDDSWWD